MVGYCVAYGCNNNQRKRSEAGSCGRKSDVTFHFFPKDTELSKKWVASLKRENFKPSSYSRICSAHFKPQDFDDDGFRRRLVKGAIPSIFNFPKHVQSSVSKPRRKLFRKSPPPPTSNPNVSLEQEGKGVDHDHGCYSKTVVGPETGMIDMQAEVISLKRKLRTPRQKLQRKTKAAEHLIDETRENQRDVNTCVTDLVIGSNSELPRGYEVFPNDAIESQNDVKPCVTDLIVPRSEMPQTSETKQMQVDIKPCVTDLSISPNSEPGHKQRYEGIPYETNERPDDVKAYVTGLALASHCESAFGHQTQNSPVPVCLIENRYNKSISCLTRTSSNQVFPVCQEDEDDSDSFADTDDDRDEDEGDKISHLNTWLS